MPDARTISLVLQRFDPSQTAVEIQPCSGGFSGAKVWKVTAGVNSFALRAWPWEQGEASFHRAERAVAIHQVMRQLHAAGLPFVPQPQKDFSGQTLIHVADCGWELLTWLPGEADYHRDPANQPQKLRAAMTALANWHLTAATITPPKVLNQQHWQTSLAGATHQSATPQLAPSPALKQRHAQLAEIRRQLLPKLGTAKIPAAWPELNAIAPRLMEEFQRAAPRVEPLLSGALAVQVPLQLCLRDVWHDHVLFSGDTETGFKVSGIIDYDAMRVESVVGDLARLLGSLLGKGWHEDRAAWQRAIESYEAVRPLNDVERSLLPAFADSMVAITGMNWLDWIIVQERTFSDRGAVIARLRENLARLVAMNESV